ncbi:MAG: hypothetical protein LBO63_02560 [Oscillospiraceae bacterium]|jgi:hypothetical protein|nr:hypothetical protein [Oscillospiraceae bacterium]
MTTVSEIFTAACALIDALDPRTGSAVSAENRDYADRTPHILTVLLGEVLPYCETGKSDTPRTFSSMEDALYLENFICKTILPQALAARLLVEENPSSAAFFDASYKSVLREARPDKKGRFEAIEDVYS